MDEQLDAPVISQPRFAGRFRTPTRDASRRTDAFHVELLCFPLVAGVYLLHLFLAGYDRFYYDAQLYWQLGRSFEHNGHFSLYAYSGATYHGYAMPLVAHVLQVVGSALGAGAITTVKVWGALFAATFGVVVAPRLARSLFAAAEVGAGRVLAFNALVFLFWRDYFNFPLSDYPALLTGCIGVLALLHRRPWGYLAAGIAFGFAVNLRPAYGLALVAAIGVAALVPWRASTLRRRAAAVSLVSVGALMALLPQVAINHRQFGTWSPSLPGGKVIALQQLSDGLIAQKYETYVGPASHYPQPEVFSFDPSTQHVLQHEHISTSTIELGQFVAITSYRQYAGIVARHPAELAASYVRHIFNGLDVRYPTPYVRDLSDTSLLLSLLEYTLMFLAIMRLLLPEARRALGSVGWAGFFVLLAACVTALPTQAESRFFLPLQLLIYLLVCFCPRTGTGLFGGSGGRRVAVAVSYVTFVLVCVTLSSATLAHRQHSESILGLGVARAEASGPAGRT